MIHILNKKDCVGCSACAQICPKSCVLMIEDLEGFMYPEVNTELCIKCGLCEKVCPVIYKKRESTKPPQCFAAKHKCEEIRTQSSSGGIFTLLAEYTLDKKGVVFGAKFDKNWDVVHAFTECKEELGLFRRSKYTQSYIGNSYKLVRDFLNSNRQVLFSGTPCQIAGLKRFLRKEYDNLLCVDFICHGVPSPKVWRLYRKELACSLFKNESNRELFIKEINFRNKSVGWKDFSFYILVSNKEKVEKSRVERFHDNVYMRGFLQNLYLRPSCHACPTKKQTSGADITIADFWGIHHYYPQFDDDRGVSLIMLGTEKGEQIYKSLSYNQISFEVNYEIALQGNSCIESSVIQNPMRTYFLKSLTKDSCIDVINRCTNASKFTWIKNIYKLRKMEIASLIKKLR